MSAYSEAREDHEADLAHEADRDAWLEQIHERCSERGHNIPLGAISCECGQRYANPMPEHARQLVTVPPAVHGNGVEF